MIPYGIIRCGSNYFKGFFAYRMHKAYLPGMQMYRSIFIGPFGPVFQITFNNTTGSGQLHPYLVVPARYQVYFKEMIIIRRSDVTVMQFCFQPVRARVVIGV